MGKGKCKGAEVRLARQVGLARSIQRITRRPVWLEWPEEWEKEQDEIREGWR